MKRGKEIKVSNTGQYNVTFGTVDNHDPKSVYINISSWGLPTSEDVDEQNYERIIKQKHSVIKRKLKKVLHENDYFIERSIIDLDMRHSGVSKNKRSFMSCEITLYQKNPQKINKEPIKDVLDSLSRKVINEEFESWSQFEFNKTKS